MNPMSFSKRELDDQFDYGEKVEDEERDAGSDSD